MKTKITYNSIIQINYYQVSVCIFFEDYILYKCNKILKLYFMTL